MPKLKTKKAVAKRFSITATGGLKRTNANRRHRLIGKTTKNKRNARHASMTTKTMLQTIKNFLHG